MRRLVYCLSALMLAVPLPAQQPGQKTPPAPSRLAPFAATAEKQDQKTGQKPLRPESRVWIVRGLTAELAMLKKTLPRGLTGLELRPDGQVDEKALETQLANNGPAARPGELVQITRVDFRKDRIVFDINGGGKRKRKWYQRIEVGSGGNTRPVATQPADDPRGSSITLDFDGSVPDVTVDQLKERLAPVLDFNQRSPAQVVTETWPKEIQEAVKNHQITAGMTRDMVLASRGRPDNKIREKKGQIEQETWVYGKVPSKVLLVTFENDEVVEAREFTPGIPATKVPRADEPPEQTSSPKNPQ